MSGAEIALRLKQNIVGKLTKFEILFDDELPDYIMVMVANKKTADQMINDLSIFLCERTESFVFWLHKVLEAPRDSNGHYDFSIADKEFQDDSDELKLDEEMEPLDTFEINNDESIFEDQIESGEILETDPVSDFNYNKEQQESQEHLNILGDNEKNTRRIHKTDISLAELRKKRSEKLVSSVTKSRVGREEEDSRASFIAKKRQMSTRFAPSNKLVLRAIEDANKSAEKNSAERSTLKRKRDPLFNVPGQEFKRLDPNDLRYNLMRKMNARKQVQIKNNSEEQIPTEPLVQVQNSNLAKVIDLEKMDVDENPVKVARTSTQHQSYRDENLLTKRALPIQDQVLFLKSIQKSVEQTRNGDMCKFWPACKNDLCKFYHPKKSISSVVKPIFKQPQLPVCKFFPNCKMGSQCQFTHPSDTKDLNKVQEIKSKNDTSNIKGFIPRITSVVMPVSTKPKSRILKSTVFSKTYATAPGSNGSVSLTKTS